MTKLTQINQPAVHSADGRCLLDWKAFHRKCTANVKHVEKLQQQESLVKSGS